MRYSKALPAFFLGFTLACGGGSDADPASEKSDGSEMKTASAADLPDPCALVTDDEISALLWRGMEAGQREGLQARNAKHVFERRVENVEIPAGRTCYIQYRLMARDTLWQEGGFQLRTLARQTFRIFAESSPSKHKPIPGVGDEAFFMSNEAFGRRGDVGVEVNFASEDVAKELLQHALGRLP